MRVILLLFVILICSCQSNENLSGNQLYSKLRSACLEILVDGQRSGSASLVSEDGYVLTAAHIFIKKAKYSAMDSSGVQYPAKLIAVDRSCDLALVKIDSKNKFNFLKLSSKPALPGDEIYQYGAAFYRANMMQLGVVCERGTSFEYYGHPNNHGVEVFHVSTTVQPGTSGGPWVNLRGEIVGVQSGIMTINKSNSGMANLAPLAKIKRLIETRTSAKTPTLEITAETVMNQRPAVLKQYDGSRGAVIVGLMKDGVGQKQGLKKDDLIVAINDQKFVFDSDYYRILRSQKIDTEFKLTIYRPNKGLIDMNVKAVELEKRFASAFEE